MTITSGDIWIAEIQFTDGSASKKRPVLILWLDAQKTIENVERGTNLVELNLGELE